MTHVDALAALLVDRYGVAPGDRVAIGMRNYPEWVIAFAAITSIGAVSVSLNAWWTADELDYALEDCGATVLIADIERVERGQRVSGPPRLSHPGGAGARATLPAGVDRWEDLRDLGAPMPDVVVTPDHDATILYTSGTTGNPKGAVSTHRAVVQSLMGFGCKAALDRLRREGGPEARAATALPPAFILIVPLFHVTGCVPVMLSCFASGLKLVIMYKWDADRALELIEREQVTNFVGVPTQSFDLLESPRFAETDTSSLTSIGGGGAPAPPELVKRVASSFRGGGPSIGYGMTETNAYGPGNNGQDYLTHPTSTGRATPILELAVRDPEGNDLPIGERGEIWFKGPHLIRGLLEQARGDRRDDRRRLAAQRRPRPRRRRRVRLRRGPRQGHGPAGGRERVLRRGGGRHLRAPGGARGGGLRRAARAPRRGGRGRRVRARRRARHRRRSCRPTSASASPASRSRASSSSSTTRSPATRPASS